MRDHRKRRNALLPQPLAKLFLYTHDSIHPFRLILPMVCLYNRQATKKERRYTNASSWDNECYSWRLVWWFGRDTAHKEFAGNKEIKLSLPCGYHHHPLVLFAMPYHLPSRRCDLVLWKGPLIYLWPIADSLSHPPLPPRWLSDLAILPTTAVIQSPRAKAGVQSSRWWCSWWGSVTINLFAFRVMNWIEPGGMSGGLQHEGKGNKSFPGCSPSLRSLSWTGESKDGRKLLNLFTNPSDASTTQQSSSSDELAHLWPSIHWTHLPL